MASHAPRTLVHEAHPTIHPNTLPPPPPRNAAFLGSQHRGHGVRLPNLSVVPTSSTGSHQATPLSAVSHSSPFSSTTGTPIVGSVDATSRGTSPMASRYSGHFSVPYDPRDWASGDVRANQAARARQQQGDDGLASPPPPYSPQSSRRDSAERAIASIIVSQDASVANHRGPQEDVSTPQSGAVLQPGLRRTSANPAQHRHSLHFGYSIPPPPPSPGFQSGLPRNVANSPGYQHGSSAQEMVPGPTVRPPTARRAVSANAGVPQRSGEPAASSRSNSKSRWQPGMPLPGPPPGPPPASSRSQSMISPRERSTSSAAQRNRPLRKTMHESGLGPVPPTPADWVEGSPMPSDVTKPLLIDTQISSTDGAQSRIHGTSTNLETNPSNNPALSRSSALRDASVKNLRERRAQNRNSRILSSSEAADLSVPTSPSDDVCSSPGPSSARTSTEPISPGRVPSGRRAKFPPLTGIIATEGEITESPMNVTIPPILLPNSRTLNDHGSRSAGIPPKALPTPPLSHKAPLSAQSAAASTQGSLPMLGSESTDDFIRDASRRHAQFLDREMSALTDLERLALFSEFIAQESVIRQERYSSAILSGHFDVQSARERVFGSTTPRNDTSRSNEYQSPGPESSSNHTSLVQSRPDSTYWNDFQPALSPIASMDYDEMSSRGRAPSRWWESQTGSQSGGRTSQIQRSKRESKYMGLSKEFLMAHSPSDELPPQNQPTYFPANNTYPREKANINTFGYYDEEEPNPTPTFAPKQPETPRLLDISRFITLPPPYPRHYPAVNNSHPDLATYRTTVRTLSDLGDVKTRRSRHQLSVDALRTDLQRKIGESRRTFRMNVQTQIQEGSITYAEAAEAEEANKLHEFDLEKETIKAEFDTLQDVVINPLHDMLNDRIQQLNTSIQHLQDDLHMEARNQDPDRPQEEGDETPELLEKLTQLKWLFDTREQIHKECFDILSERNDKYKAIVLFPYVWNNHSDKVQDTELFFEKDTRTRLISFCDEAAQRHQAFLNIIEQHVMRGVELQSSAFWDIAPGLLDLLQKLPENMRDLPAIQIPAKEYEENPSYRQHPHQYLYSLLTHAEKSTYQFIESQTNLHCLLHEAKTGMLSTRYRSLQLREENSGVQRDSLLSSRQQEEGDLTGELKQKASMIEQQWLEALGSQLQGTRERVKTLLIQDDAWEEISQED